MLKNVEFLWHYLQQNTIFLFVLSTQSFTVYNGGLRAMKLWTHCNLQLIQLNQVNDLIVTIMLSHFHIIYIFALLLWYIFNLSYFHTFHTFTLSNVSFTFTFTLLLSCVSCVKESMGKKVGRRLTYVVQGNVVYTYSNMAQLI